MPSIAGFPCLASTEAEFRVGLLVLAERLQTNVDYLAGVMSFESNLDPAAKNPKSSASGLIQFMEETAKRLGTTTKAIRAMNRMEQLPLVERYFRPWTGKLKTPSDCYLAVFYPCAIGKSDDWVVASANPEPGKTYCGTSAERNKAVYDQNAAVFDRGKRGYYTKADIVRTFMSHYNAAMARPRVEADAPAVAHPPKGCKGPASGGGGGGGGGGGSLPLAAASISGGEGAMVLLAAGVAGFYFMQLGRSYFSSRRA